MPASFHRWSHLSFLALVALLPLHTVFWRSGIAVKPWLVILPIVVFFDWVVARGLPWGRRVSIYAVLFLLAALASWPAPDAPAQFWRLWLALVAGVLLMLTVGAHGRSLVPILRVVFWSGAALAASAIVLSMLTNGTFGESGVTAVNDLPFIDRINKPAYLREGFLALTNWHQDPGYAALWTNGWLVLSFFAWTRGVVRAPAWVGPIVLGALTAASTLTFSRTGWIGLGLSFAIVLLAHWRSPDLDLARALKTAVATIAIAGALLAGLIAIDRPQVGGDVLTAIEFRLTYLAELGFVDLGEPGFVDPDLVVEDNRLDVWNEYLQRFTDSPVRGIGLGSGWAEPGLQEPHNMWIELLAETGVVGLIGFGCLLYGVGLPRSWESRAILVLVFVAGLSQTVLFEPILWLGFGLAVASNGNPAASNPYHSHHPVATRRGQEG